MKHYNVMIKGTYIIIQHKNLSKAKDIVKEVINKVYQDTLRD